ncbi:glycosyltransferase family 2 protein [uncultured Bacteroides sp.]|uniref:glycosyltransferase family 2 protein n=1 Tax=uncultured Bacteroides sp. TaxID=162156 RepID=UPI002AA88524|nr:glycosyltransferase family 2 protein [uncultured Bacteroides sp.]
MIKISIIIATWNVEKTLKRCLDSIVCQLTNDCELIIIDGDSKDSTNQIINSYNEYITYSVSERDNGIYDAWNKAIIKAKGEWLMFLGADDMLKPDFVSTYTKFLEIENVYDVDIISAKAQLVDNDGKYLTIMGEPYSWDVFKYRMNISHGSTLHRRTLFDELGLFDTNIKICADYDFLLRKKMNAIFIDKELIIMQYGGMSHSLKGVKDGYLVRAKNHSIPKLLNLIILAKASIGFLLKTYIKYKIN